MKTRLIFTAVTLAVILYACQQVAFTDPQPKDVAALKAFPARLRGNYLNSDDSTLLQITAQNMVRIYNYEEKIHVSQLDSNEQIIGDSLFDTETNTGQPIRIEGDSLVRRVSGSDTLFAIGTQNVLKKYKGCYFLNSLLSADTWQVQKLELSRGKLTLSNINSKDDLAQLKEITETPQDTMPVAFSLTRQQFKNFVQNDGFRDRETFYRLKQ